jgi:hypothetical protein
VRCQRIRQFKSFDYSPIDFWSGSMDRERRQEQASGYWKAAFITGFTPNWKLSEDECRTRRESSQAKDMIRWKEIRSRVAGD